ncbi:hypothetical protein ACIG56_15980 [Nocardia fusca]|uniref:hypothetical protein n=1 Tax=Nocardia fusca TaxID=941183 RepID=UPI0037C8CA00
MNDAVNERVREVIADIPRASHRNDGRQAIWRVEGHSIRVVALRSAFDTSATAPFRSAHPPDLADMRQRFPELSLLWDAIRHEYRRRFLPS